MSINQFSLWIAGLLIIATTAACGSRPEHSELGLPNLTVSMYEGNDQLSSQEVTLAQVLDLGKPIVLNFWAGLCPPCRAEMPDIQRVYDERGHKVTLLGIDIGPFMGLGTRDQGKALFDELELSYPAGTTFDEKAIRELEIVGMPTTIFLSRNGQILRRWIGFLTKAKLNELVDLLLAES